jgi:hypothetical protein
MQLLFSSCFYLLTSCEFLVVALCRGDWVQLQRGTVATQIKKGIKYLLVVLKKLPLEYHMGKQLCVKFGCNRRFCVFGPF